MLVVGVHSGDIFHEKAKLRTGEICVGVCIGEELLELGSDNDNTGGMCDAGDAGEQVVEGDEYVVYRAAGVSRNLRFLPEHRRVNEVDGLVGVGGNAADVA